MSGSTVMAADAWQQGLNPDRYTGYDYVTSFTLSFSANPDNSETVVAPAPGRYKILAYSGGQAYQTYLVIPPATPAPAIRGFAYGLYGPVDQATAIGELTTGLKAGMNWVSFWFEGCMDFDSGNITVQVLNIPSCSPASEADVGWLIDEAHSLGYKVAFVPYTNAILQGQENELEWFLLNGYAQQLPAIATIFQAFAQWQIAAATLAAAHNADALVIGNNFQTSSSSQDSTLAPIWSQTISQIRPIFNGRIWVGWVFPCGPSFDFTTWSSVDGIDFVPIIPGSGAFCSSSTAGQSNFPTAQEMLPNFLNTQNLPAFQLEAANSLPMIWLGMSSNNFDGMNYLAPSTNTDNQEDVDVFEGMMQAKSQVPGQMDAAIVDGPDIMLQPAFYGALANWFGGDLSYFSPCWVPPPPGILFENSFDSGACPLLAGGSANSVLSPIYNPSDVSVITDPANASNHVLEISPSGSAGLGDGSTWTDYTFSAQVRTASSQAIATLGFRNSYFVQVFSGSMGLFKSGQQLASSQISGGLPLNVFNSVLITVQGGAITVALNGTTLLTYTDPSPILSGGASLTICCGSSSGSYDFDNIVVSSLASPAVPACTYSASTSSLSFSSSGGPGVFHVISSDPACTWDSAAGADWISITSGLHGAGSVPVLFTLAPNATGSSRSANLIAAGQTVQIQQQPCGSYQINPPSATFGGAAASGTFSITAPGCSWNITGVPSWLTVKPTSGTGSAIIDYSAPANTTGAALSASLNIVPPAAGGASTFGATDVPQVSFSSVIVHFGDAGWSTYLGGTATVSIPTDYPHSGQGSLRLQKVSGNDAAQYYYSPAAPLGTWGSLNALSVDYNIAQGPGQYPTIALLVYQQSDSRSFYVTVNSCTPLACPSISPVGSWQTLNGMTQTFQLSPGRSLPASVAAIPADAPIWGVSLWSPYSNAEPWTAYAQNLTVGFQSSGWVFKFEPALGTRAPSSVAEVPQHATHSRSSMKLWVWPRLPTT